MTMRLDAKLATFCVLVASTTALACGRASEAEAASGLEAGQVAQHEHGGEHEGHEGMPGTPGMEDASKPASGSSAWAELKSVRDAIAQLMESGKLAEVHNQAERLAPLGDALRDGAKGLPDDKRARVEAALRQLPELGKTLDKAGDAGDVEATRRELKRLDGVIALLQAQYPADLLPKVPAPAGMPGGAKHSDGEHSGHEMGAHAHAARPLAAVDEAPKATLRVKSSEFKFEPTSLAMKAGEPTRIELENDGAIEHALIVAAPDGKGDWIHLHAMANSTDAGTFRIDRPGKYRVLCTVPGHTEAGMVGELSVQ
jgi:uncharacterized cupredoxin-like copper-binding protein